MERPLDRTEVTNHSLFTEANSDRVQDAVWPSEPPRRPIPFPSDSHRDVDRGTPDTESLPSSPPSVVEPDPRSRLQHVLTGEATIGPRPNLDAPPGLEASAHPKMPSDGLVSDIRIKQADAEDYEQPQRGLDTSNVPGASNTGRRVPNNGGTTSSIYGGNKMKHIKKEDGIPLWRKDIQYDFLRAVFEDTTACFTSPYDARHGLTFADIYIEAMARSTKTSKILRDKLLSDRVAALNMAMVCLLVNVGRMNTTLNFFPEMRAQLRTYHAIPCLQLQQDPNAYKQLQDAPRLKSILKGTCEGKNEPSTIEKLRSTHVPRTNPVNLIFVLSQYAPKLTELHFNRYLDFFDLVTRTTLSSLSRGRCFLWLMWWYLESDFSAEAAENNPFGPGEPPEVDGVPQKVGPFVHLTELQANAENVDTQEEVSYGLKKQEERKKIIECDAASAPPVSKRSKKSLNTIAPSDDGVSSPTRDGLSPHPFAFKSGRTSSRSKGRAYPTIDTYPSDTDRTRSMSPPGLHPTFDLNDHRHALGPKRSSLLAGDGTPGALQSVQKTGRGKWPRDRGDRVGTQRLVLKTKHDSRAEGSSPAPHGSRHGGLHTDVGSGRRARPLTAHQLAVERHRQQRVDYLLDRRRRKLFKASQKARKKDGAVWRAWMRHEAMTSPFIDSDNEIGESNGPYRDRGFGGLMALQLEPDDYGEEVAAYAAAVRRMGRRLERWDGLGLEAGAGRVIKTQKMPLTERKAKEKAARRARRGEAHLEEADGLGQPHGSSLGLEGGDHDEEEEGGEGGELDDMDRELLGEADGEEEEGEGEGEGDAEDDEGGSAEKDEMLLAYLLSFPDFGVHNRKRSSELDRT
ncbi:MAG: hypothetical protein M1817_004436 [Caeruleum heppii]|nr:MAG: hypothetical protein M1817_004436 [Caeruleum heppii]